MLNAIDFGAAGGQDVGDALRDAYAALPATGGSIYLPGDADAYLLDSAVEFDTPGKYVLLYGDPGSTYINFTPTAAENAFVLDYAPDAGGAYLSAHGMRNIILLNDAENLNPNAHGSSSLAVGILIGPDRDGAQNGTMEGLTIKGFGTGVLFGGDGASWGMVFNNCSFAQNHVGVDIPIEVEQTTFIGGRFAVNDTGLKNYNTSDVHLVGMSIDSNESWGIDNQGIITCDGCHFENSGVDNTNYINSTSGSVVVNGGLILDDDSNTGATPRLYYIHASSIAQIYVYGVSVYSGGRPVTQVVQCEDTATAFVAAYTASPTPIPTFVSSHAGVELRLADGFTPKAILHDVITRRQVRGLVLNLVASTGFVNIGEFMYGGLFLIRDTVHGHTGLLLIEGGSGTPITIIAQSGNTPFVLSGNPGSTEIRFQLVDGFKLQAKAGSSRNAVDLQVLQLSVWGGIAD